MGRLTGFCESKTENVNEVNAYELLRATVSKRNTLSQNCAVVGQIASLQSRIHSTTFNGNLMLST